MVTRKGGETTLTDKHGRSFRKAEKLSSADVRVHVDLILFVILSKVVSEIDRQMYWSTRVCSTEENTIFKKEDA